MLDHGQPRGTEYRRMIRPGWCADEHARFGPGADNQLSGKSQCSGTARCLQAGQAGAQIEVAKHDRLDCANKANIAFRPKISFGLLCFQQSPFGRFHCAENRRFPCRIAIDSDADIDFVGTRVTFECRNQRQQCVSWQSWEAIE